MSASPLFEDPEIYLRRVRDAGEEPEWEFPCECGKEDCHERVFLTLDECIALRERFGLVLADGHSRSQIVLARQLRDEGD
jgi:hypothetical protein